MRSIAAFLIILSTASLSWAGKRTDLENFERAVSKVAPLPFNWNGKKLCVCFSTALPQAGYLYAYTEIGSRVVVACFVPVFDPTTGELGQISAGCTDDWDVLR